MTVFTFATLSFKRHLLHFRITIVERTNYFQFKVLYCESKTWRTSTQNKLHPCVCITVCFLCDFRVHYLKNWPYWEFHIAAAACQLMKSELLSSGQNTYLTEDYHWKLLTLDNIQLPSRDGLNTWKHFKHAGNIQGCMLTDTNHLGIIQHPNSSSDRGSKIEF